MAMEANKQPLNAVLGDAGFVTYYGRTPTAGDSEASRITAHLLHVVDILARQDCGGLASRRGEDCDGLASRRACMIMLAEYARAGRFPTHARAPVARTPIFVDHLDTPCAVAHLLRGFGASELCQAIDAEHHHAYVSDILDARDSAAGRRLEEWCKHVGLAPADLAMIQPRYSEHDTLCERLVVCGVSVTAGSLITGIAGFALVALDNWPPRVAHGALAICGSVQILWVVLIVPWLWCVGARHLDYRLLHLPCFVLPVSLLLWIIVSVSIVHNPGKDTARKTVCVVAWACLVALFGVALAVACFCPNWVGVRRKRGRGRRKEPESTEASDTDESHDSHLIDSGDDDCHKFRA